jgi:hypothetical protein
LLGIAWSVFIGSSCTSAAPLFTYTQLHTSAYVSIRQHTSAYISILRCFHWLQLLRQYLCFCTSVCVSICTFVLKTVLGIAWSVFTGSSCTSAAPLFTYTQLHTSAYVSIRQHTSAYVSILRCFHWLQLLRQYLCFCTSVCVSICTFVQVQQENRVPAVVSSSRSISQ